MCIDFVALPLAVIYRNRTQRLLLTPPLVLGLVHIVWWQIGLRNDTFTFGDRVSLARAVASLRELRRKEKTARGGTLPATCAFSRAKRDSVYIGEGSKRGIIEKNVRMALYAPLALPVPLLPHNVLIAPSRSC